MEGGQSEGHGRAIIFTVDLRRQEKPQASGRQTRGEGKAGVTPVTHVPPLKLLLAEDNDINRILAEERAALEWARGHRDHLASASWRLWSGLLTGNALRVPHMPPLQERILLSLATDNAMIP